jgi:gluconolactonase
MTAHRFAKILSALALLIALQSAPARADKPVDKPVQKMDQALDVLISPDAKMDVVKEGFGFTEGITWVEKGRYLLISDMPANVIFKLTPDGKQSLYLDHSGYTGYDVWRRGFMQTNGRDKSDPKFEEFPMFGSNGLTMDPQGRLVIATWAGRGIDRIEKNGKRVTLTNSIDGKRFNGTNDLIVKKDGTIYFTDGFGGLRGRDKDPEIGIDYSGVFMWKNGKTSLVIKEISNTNGLALSPDEKILYANGGRDKYIRAYDVQPDGTLANSRMLIDMSADKRIGITDGMKVDTKGNIWESGPTGVWVISPEGKHLGTILVPELVANVEFGDPDHKTLYIAARSSVYKIRVNIPGIP